MYTNHMKLRWSFFVDLFCDSFLDECDNHSGCGSVTNMEMVSLCTI